jgi:hypothetical protein
MSDNVKTGFQLRIRRINEILSEGIFTTVVRALWRFVHLAAILLLCRDAKFRWDILEDDLQATFRMNQENLVTARTKSRKKGALGL